MPQLWTHKYEYPSPGKWVFVPTTACRERGLEIVSHIKSHWNPPDYFYHLREGGHVAALRKHLGSTWFIKADIQGFFTSINKSRVTNVLNRFYPQYGIAREHAIWSVAPNPNYPQSGRERLILPYGFVQSPLLASAALHQSALGSYLGRLNTIQDIRLGVYMDDIIISGPATIDGEDIMMRLKAKAERSRFTFHPEKTVGPVCGIDAFNITLAQDTLVIKEERLEEFRKKLAQSSNPHILQGIQTYIASVNREQLF
jgi:hypothetical protein